MPVTTNAGGESGPDPATFGGGAGAAGGIVGTNHLQSAVDKFTDSVTKLEGVATKLQAIPALSKGAGMLGSMASGANQPGPSSSGGTFPKLCNPFPTSSSAYKSQTPYGGQMAASPNGGITPPPSSVYPPGQQPPGMPQSQQTNGGFPNVQNPFGGGAQPPPGGGPPATVGGSGGPPANTTGNFPSVQNPYSSAGGTGQGGAPPGGGAPPNGGGSTHQSPSTTFGELAAGAYTGLAQTGASDMTGQISLNSYQQGASIGGIGPGGGTYGGNQKALAQQAYGTAGGGSQGGKQKQNIFGTSPQDLAQSFAIMGAQAGNPMLNQSSLGSNLLKGTAQFGYLNPAMSGAQSAQAMQQLYSPQSSMKQRMLGYSTTPLQAGKPGGANSMAKWAAGQFQTMDFGGMNKKPTANQMRAELGPNGIMSANLKAEGLNPSQYAAPLETYNALYQGLGQKGKSHPALNVSQAQKLMSGLSSQDPKKQSASENTLQNYGVNKNDLDKLKGVAGSKAASQGDKSAGFTSGLAGATRALQDFSQALNQALNTLHANNAVGAGQGFAGTMKSAGGGMGGGLVGGLAAGLAGKGIGGLLGKVLGKSKSPIGKLFGGGGGGAGGAAGGAEGAAGAGGTEAAAGGGGGVFGDLMGALGGAGSGGAGVLGGVGMGAVAGTAGIAGGAAIAEGAAHHLLGKIPGTKGKGKTSLTGHIGRAGQDLTAFNNIEPQHLMGHMWDAGKNILSGIGHLFGGGAGASMGPIIAANSKGSKNKVSQSVPKQAQTAVKMAESQQGVPYQWGAETPGKGFDCAGLTQWAYSRAGVKLPRTAKEQWEYLSKSEVKLTEVKEGDLVFGEGTDGQLGHVGLMTAKNKVIQAPQPGSKVAISNFSAAQWIHAARPAGSHSGKRSTDAGKAGTSKNPIIKAGSKPNGSPAGSPTSAPAKDSKTVTGATIAAYAEKFAGHKYVLGGPGDYQKKHDPPFGAWDCAGFVSQMYDHFGLGSPTSGINVSALIGWSKKSKSPVVGGMAFFAGSDGTSSHPGHVGLVTGKNKSIQAMDEALGTRNASLAGAVAFGVPPHGFAGGGSASGGSSGGGSGSGASVQKGLSASGGGGMGGADLGSGDSSGEGSTSEVAAFAGAISGGANAGSGYYGNSQQVEEVVPGSGGSGGGGGTGSAAVNGTGGTAIYNYLLANVFGGKKIAAAGAIASIYGESTWDPESKGTGGRGLIGWTPASTLPDSAFTGNAKKDMAAQLPLIKKFIQTSGDAGVINQMKSATTILQAANEWGKGVERFGINDVHSAGLAKAKAIAGLATGGAAAAGSTILAGERGPELVHVGNQPANVITSDQTQKLLKSAVGSPEGPYSKGGGSAMNFSSAHPIYSGGTGNNKGKGGAQVNLNFTSGSIVIQMPSSTGSLPTGASARKAATEIVDHLGKMDIYSAISSGSNS